MKCIKFFISVKFWIFLPNVLLSRKKKIGVQFKYVSLCFLNLFVKFIL